MAKIKVKNLAQLENAVKGLIHDGMFFSSNLQDTSGEMMSDVIKENVYNAFTPKEYERRGDDGGFSDAKGIVFTEISNVNNGLVFKLENMNEGNDSMSGKTLTDMFENGNESDWNNPNVTDNQGRINSTERPFIQSTIDDMNQNKGELYDSLRKDLRNLGFKIK